MYSVGDDRSTIDYAHPRDDNARIRVFELALLAEIFLWSGVREELMAQTCVPQGVCVFLQALFFPCRP
jgi:hypothetical protein